MFLTLGVVRVKLFKFYYNKFLLANPSLKMTVEKFKRQVLISLNNFKIVV